MSPSWPGRPSPRGPICWRGGGGAAPTRGAGGAGRGGGGGGAGPGGWGAGPAAAPALLFVVLPAGTRNHFALDLGLDRDDPAKALEALTHGVELRVDLGYAADRVFVNNAS